MLWSGIFILFLFWRVICARFVDKLSFTDFVKGSSNALPAVYSISQGSGATGLRKINTPWPFVVGQAIIAVFLFYIGDKSWRSHGLEPVIFGGKFILLAARCLGAIAFLISDMVHGGTFPSVGMMLIFENFLTLGYPLISEERSSGQYKVCLNKWHRQILTFHTSLSSRNDWFLIGWH